MREFAVRMRYVWGMNEGAEVCRWRMEGVGAVTANGLCKGPGVGVHVQALMIAAMQQEMGRAWGQCWLKVRPEEPQDTVF